MTGDPVDALVQIASIQPANIPPSVVDRALRVIADTVGATILGSGDGFLRGLAPSLIETAAGRSTVLGANDCTDPGRAALLNSAASTSTLVDEGHRMSRGHPGSHVVPVALAIAESEGCSGSDLISAVVAGYEVAARIGVALVPMRPGLHAQGQWPVIGAAVAGARLLGANEAELRECIETAAAFVLYPPASATIAGSSSFAYHAGLGCQIAVQVAYGAVVGMTGAPGTLVDHFTQLSTGRPDPLTLSATERFEILGNYFKPWPVCAHFLTIIQAMREIRPQITDAAAVKEVIVKTYDLALGMNDTRPATRIAAKFSIPYVIAVMLQHSQAGIYEFHTTDMHGKESLALMSRVSVVGDVEFDRRYPAERPAEVTVVFDDGRRISATSDIPLGDDSLQFTDDQLRSKFAELATPTLGANQQDRLYMAIHAMRSDSSDLAELISLCRPGLET